MATLRSEYLGNSRVSTTHVESNTTIVTDAPVDNGGKGESFSPTDLTAMSLSSCAMTIIGMYAENHGLDVKGTTIDTVKVMSSNPRRIAKIESTFTMPANNFSDKDKQVIEKLVKTCPVHLTLAEEVEQVFNFIWL